MGIRNLTLLAIGACTALAAAQGPRGGFGPRGTTGNVPLSTPPIIAPTPVPLAPIETNSPPTSNNEVKVGSVTGSVVRGGTQDGLSGARVRLIPVTQAGLDTLSTPDETDEGADPDRLVHTDAGGRFSFPTVPPGRYTLIAQRDGFVRQAFGQRGVNEFGATIGVAVGQTLDVTLQMRPAPTISGTITNATREPLAGAIVQAFRLHYIPFGRELRLTQTAMTDDHGEYRLFWLTPGDYYVAVTHSRTSERKLPAELPENPNLSKPDDVYSGIYYPGQTNWTDAKAIRVSAADVPGINMTWTEAGRVPVRGQITGGPPANAKITLLLEDGNPVPGFSQPVRSDATGAFTMRVTPGDYVLVAESEDGRHFSEVMPLIVPSRGIELLKVPLNLGLLMGGIALGANDLEGVLLKLCRTGPPTLGSKGCYGNYSYASHGKVLLQQFFLPFDDFEVFISLPSGFVLNTVPIVRRTALEPGPALSGTPMDPPTAAAENPDKVRPAKSLRNGSLSKADLLSMNQGEVPLVADLTGCEIAVGGVPNACLMFAVGGGGPGISGNVRNAIGDGISGAQVILVPEAPRGGIRPPNRYFRGASDATGRFEIPGVPAGVYTALAFEELEPGAYFASDFLERYGLRGVQVNPASIQNRGGRGGTNPDSVNLVIIPREDADR